MFNHISVSDPSKASPQGSYIVLRVADIEKSAAFYRLLGLVLTEERHGDGPRHYSFPFSSDMVCELYPFKQGAGAAQNIRLGFVVENAEELKTNLLRAGCALAPGTSANSFVVIDPDGNQVELDHPIRG
jgi:lactoylglutathione lyase